MKKTIIALVIIAGLYFLLAVFGSNMLDGSKTLYIDDNTIWEYSKRKWTSRKNVNSSFELKKYNIYSTISKENIGKYDLKFDDENWYIYTNNKYNLYDETLFAYKGNIKPYKYDVSFEIDKTVINDILRKVNISRYEDLNLTRKIVIDLDNDGNDEILYAISNVYSQGNEEILFSIVALYKDGRYSIIKNLKNNEDTLLNIFAIIDVNGDKKLELVLVNEGFSLSGNTYSLYELENDEYEVIINAD